MVNEKQGIAKNNEMQMAVISKLTCCTVTIHIIIDSSRATMSLVDESCDMVET